MEKEGDAVDVARAVEEKEAGTCEGMISAAGDLENADVVVEGVEFGEGLHLVRRDAIVVVLAAINGVLGGSVGFHEKGEAARWGFGRAGEDCGDDGFWRLGWGQETGLAGKQGFHWE